MVIKKIKLVSSIILGVASISHAVTFSSDNIVVNNFKCTPVDNVSFSNENLVTTENIYMAVLMSWLAHEPSPEQRNTQLSEWGFDNSKSFGKDKFGHRGFVASQKDFSFITFRGSQTTADYLSNAFFYQAEMSEELGIKNAMVHKGMGEVYHKNYQDIMSAISEIIPKNKPVYISGHSLGGALANLFAITLQNQGYTIAGIYTAGTPKFANSAVANHIENNLSDVIVGFSIDSDITPMVPPAPTSAKEFSSIISSKAPKLRSFFYNLVKKLDYAENVGSNFYLKFDTQDAIFSDDTFTRREISYWREITSALSDRDRPKDLFKFISSRFITHHPDNYICALTSLIDKQ